MSKSPAPSDDAAAAMLDLVERHEREARRAILDDATAKAEGVVAAARATSRERVRAAIREASDRARRRVEEAQAGIATRRRYRSNEVRLQLLDRAWARLPDALVERWNALEDRRRWIAAMVDRALSAFPSERWTIEHPTHWSSSELAPWLERIRQQAGDEPRLEPRSATRCGLRISAGGVVLDGTEVGLLADRGRVRGHLLRELVAAGVP